MVCVPELPTVEQDRRTRVGTHRRAGGRRWEDNPFICRALEREILALGGLANEIREEHGLSLEQLAKRSNLSFNTILAIENAKANPRITTLMQLFAALGCQVVVGIRRDPKLQNYPI